MDKFYQLKLYENDWTYVKTLNPRLEFGEKTFSAIINGGVSNMEFCFDVAFSDTTVSIGQFIKVIEYDDNNKSWTTVYTWYAERITRKLTEKWAFVCVECIWLFALMTRVIYKDTGDRTHVKTDDPWDIISDIVSAFNSDYGWSWLSVWSIDIYWSNVSIAFNNRSCANSIKDVQDAVQSWWYFYVAGDWSVYFKQNPTTPSYLLKVWPEVTRMEVTEIGTVVNTVWVNYDWWPEATDSDATSISTYWLSEIRLDKTDLQDNSTATLYADQYITANKDFIPQIVIDVVNRDDLEQMRPGQTVTLYNSPYTVTNKQINKVVYSEKKVTLYLENFESFWGQFLS